MPQHHFETSISCSRLIEELLNRQGKGSFGGSPWGSSDSGPSEAQIKFMVGLAQRAGTGLPAEALKSKAGASRWIENNGGQPSNNGRGNSGASIEASEQPECERLPF